MKIIALRPFSGPYGAPTTGETLDVPDEHAEALVAANYAKPADGPKPEAKPAKKASRRKAAAEPKTETATEPDEVETATTEE